MPTHAFTEGGGAVTVPSVLTGVEAPRRGSPAVASRERAKLDLFLLWCGVVAPVIYVATDVFLALRWQGYSYRDQTISELNAIGAPTRTLSIILGIIGYLFLASFGIGVWRSAVRSRRLRFAAAALIAFGVFGCFGVPFMSMHVRGADKTLTDALHIAQLGLAGPLVLAIIGFGAAAFGWRFRIYSATTVIALLAFGAWSGTYGADIADNLSTPWVGVIERASVYSYQLWFITFALTLLIVRAQSAGPTAHHAGRDSRPQRHG